MTQSQIWSEVNSRHPSVAQNPPEADDDMHCFSARNGSSKDFWDRPLHKTGVCNGLIAF